MIAESKVLVPREATVAKTLKTASKQPQILFGPEYESLAAVEKTDC
jgi:hypothetical protein